MKDAKYSSCRYKAYLQRKILAEKEDKGKKEKEKADLVKKSVNYSRNNEKMSSSENRNSSRENRKPKTETPSCKLHLLVQNVSLQMTKVLAAQELINE